jgi:hypothetical protein
MQSRKRKYSALAAAVAAAGGLAAAALATAGGPANASRTDPASLLQCSGDRFIATHVTHDNVTKETRTPEQLAAAWAATTTARGAASAPAEQRNAFAAAAERDVVFVDKADQVVAVLSYERDAALGWRLDSIVECA